MSQTTIAKARSILPDVLCSPNVPKVNSAPQPSSRGWNCRRYVGSPGPLILNPFPKKLTIAVHLLGSTRLLWSSGLGELLIWTTLSFFSVGTAIASVTSSAQGLMTPGASPFSASIPSVWILSYRDLWFWTMIYSWSWFSDGWLLFSTLHTSIIWGLFKQIYFCASLGLQTHEVLHYLKCDSIWHTTHHFHSMENHCSFTKLASLSKISN